MMILFHGMLEQLLESFFEIGNKARDYCKDLYPDVEELEPHRAPYALGKSVFIRVYVEANHTGNMLNMRYHTCILIYMNNRTIIWFSKRQNTV